MKILHCCLSNLYVDNFTYQENILSKQMKDDGHEVLIIASTETYINGKLDYVRPKTYINEYGIKVIRLPYLKILPHFLMKKLRAYKGVLTEIKVFNPDVIFFHGVQGYELLNISKYKENNPNIKLYADNHAYIENSARNFLSKYILHKLFYRFIIKRSLKNIDKIFYLSEESKYFLDDFYKIPKEKLEFYPLGGFIKEEDEKMRIRKKIRETLKISEEDIILIHSGRMDKLKRTKEILQAFIKVKNNKLHLLIIGSIPNEEKEVLENLINSDKRVKFLGWKSGDELLNYICASDIYVQPGSQSVTCQNTICCGVPIILYPYISYKKIFDKNIFWVKTEKDIEKVISIIVNNPNILKEMSKESYKIAKKVLDYRKLAARLYK